MKKIALVFAPILISACAGGSSSSSSSSGSASTNAFTSWSATISANTPVSFTSGSTSTMALDGTSVQTDADGAATLALGGNGNFSAISASTPTSSVSFSAANGDTLQSGFYQTSTIALNKSETTIGVFTNPTYYGFEYQTYGAWGAYGNATTSANAISVGSATPVTGIPATGSYTFTGGASGYYTDPSKFAYVTNANMTATASFDARTVAFSTSGTYISGAPSGNAVAAPDLNLSGTLSIAAGANKVSGNVTTINGMSGNANGKFYGPTANEVGGTYAVSGSNLGSFVGGFGGKR
jgi:hypothetical protein